MSRTWWGLEKELLPIRCLFMEGKVGRNSIFNLLHIPYNSHKERLFFYHCTDKGNHFFSLEEKYGNEINCQVLVALFRYVLHAIH